METTPSTSWLQSIINPLRPIFREVIAMSAFVNLLALAVPIFTMQVFNRVVSSTGVSTLQGLVIGMVFVFIFDYILRQSRSRIMQTVALRVDVQVGQLLFNKVVALPMQVLEAKPAAYWQSLFRDVDVIRNTLSGATAILVADLPFAILFLGLVFVIAPAIAWVLLIILPAFMFVAWRSGNVMSAANQEERQTTMSRDGMISEMINGRTTIKALALDTAMRPVWEGKHADNIEKSIARGSKTDSYSNLGSTLSMFTSVCLTTVGALAIMDQRLTIGGLIATNMLSGRLLGPFNQLVGQWRAYTGFRQAQERLGEIFNTPSERQESEISLDKPKGDLKIENVSFSYAENLPPVVDRIEAKFEHGKIHALVGRNGSGKTTLLKLILGLYKPTDGRVLLDDADISQFTRKELAGWIGYVPQDCILFEGSVHDNIIHRIPDASDEDVLKAAKASGVHQFIIDLPDGYATEIGEAGQRLSGGQRQRISIARALVGDPPVIMLDEPSSSLDRQAEQELKKTLIELSQRHTIIVVTHSPLLLGACDNLIALDKGKIALAGPAKDILPRLFGIPAKNKERRPPAVPQQPQQAKAPPQQPVRPPQQQKKPRPPAPAAPAAKPAPGKQEGAKRVKAVVSKAQPASKPVARIKPRPKVSVKPAAVPPAANKGQDKPS